MVAWWPNTSFRHALHRVLRCVESRRRPCPSRSVYTGVLALASCSTTVPGRLDPKDRLKVTFGNKVFWIRTENQDCDSNLRALAPGSHPSVYAQACLETEGCTAFTTHGVLKTGAAARSVQATHTHLRADQCSDIIASEPGVDLFVLQAKAVSPRSAFPFIWPLPQQFTNGSTAVTVDALQFTFTSNVSSADLDAAFVRFNASIFSHPMAPAAVPADTPAITGVLVLVLMCYSLSSHK